LAGDVLRAALQTASQPGMGLSQPRCRAGQSSCVRSACQPGSSAQSTGTQRARGRNSGVAAADAAANGPGERDSTGAGPPAGPLPQAASAPVKSAAMTRRATIVFMWLILLEALAALVILVLIVWWTMFSGRRKGERRRDDAP
jgi:cobalamin biosynthesis Mg chelatase CobN